MGLIGENGAGKSTLIKILCGIYHADSGEIILNGKNVSIPTAQAAKDLGISTIYQELSIIPDLNAVQNIFLNRELAPGNSLFSKLKYSEMKEKARKVLEEELADAAGEKRSFRVFCEEMDHALERQRTGAAFTDREAKMDQVFRDMAEYLACGITNFVNVLNPRKVIVGYDG